MPRVGRTRARGHACTRSPRKCIVMDAVRDTWLACPVQSLPIPLHKFRQREFVVKRLELGYPETSFDFIALVAYRHALRYLALFKTRV